MKLRRENFNMESIEIDEKVIKRLKQRIIIEESKNLKSRKRTDQQMIEWIKEQIKEEAECYLNQ